MQTLTFTEFKKRYDVNFKAQKGDTNFVGQGGYGNVYLGRNIKQHIDVAIKRSPTDKKLLDEVERGKVVPEHPNIARYIEGFRVDGESEDFDVAILQYYPNGNLDQLAAKYKLSESQLDDILRGILEGLQFLHEGFKEKKGNKISIIHRDLKPQNILISEYKGVFTPLISDFGISKTVYQDENGTGGSIEQSGDAGTIVYKAPEQIKGGKIRTNLDFWAFGVMLFKILKRKLPFYSTAHPSTDAFKNEVMKKITDADLNDIFTQLTDQPQKYQDIIKRCLVRDIKERVQTAAELIDILDGIQLLLVNAQKLHSEGLLQEAFTVYQQVVQLRPNHPIALSEKQKIEQVLQKSEDLIQKISSHFTEGNVAAAQKELDSLKKLYPKHPSITEFEKKITQEDPLTYYTLLKKGY